MHKEGADIMRNAYLQKVEHLRQLAEQVRDSDEEEFEKAYRAYESAVAEMPMEFDKGNLTEEEADILLEAKFLTAAAIGKGMKIDAQMEQFLKEAEISSKAKHGYKLPIANDQMARDQMESDRLTADLHDKEKVGDAEAETSLAELVEAIHRREAQELNKKLHEPKN
jgi:hypothetical protein